MKRWLVLGAMLAILATIAFLGPDLIPYLHRDGEDGKPQDECGYQAALASYSVVLKPGITRAKMLEYLRGKQVVFAEMSGVDTLGTVAVLVKIGEERAPLFCSENYVYVAFHFNPAAGPRGGRYENPADTLKELTIYHLYGGCL